MIGPTVKCLFALLGLIAIAVCPVACSNEEQNLGDKPLLSWGDEAITISDLDKFFLSIEFSQMQPPSDKDMRQWLEPILLTLFERRQYLSSEKDKKLESREHFQKMMKRRSRIALAQAFLQQNQTVGIAEKEQIKETFEKFKDILSSPEKRFVFHFLLSIPNNASKEEKNKIKQRAVKFREKVAHGAGFAEIARKYSDSASSVFGGILGQITREDLRPELADVIFSLEIGQISPVIETAAGFQFFMVQEILPPSSPRFEDIGKDIAEFLKIEARSKWYLEKLKEEATSFGVELPDWSAASDFLKLSDDAPIFSLKDTSAYAGEFRFRISNGMPPISAFQQLVGETVFAEVFKRDHPELVSKVVEVEKRSFALQYLQNEAEKKYLDALSEKQREDFYRIHKNRMYSFPKVKLVLYSWPLGSIDPILIQKRANEFVVQSQAPGASTDSIWENEFSHDQGVLRREMPELSLHKLLESRKDLAYLLMMDLKKGQILGPVRAENFLVVAFVANYQPSRPIPYEEAGDFILKEYRQVKGDQFNIERRQALCKKLGCQIDYNSLDHYGDLLLEHILID